MTASSTGGTSSTSNSKPLLPQSVALVQGNSSSAADTSVDKTKLVGLNALKQKKAGHTPIDQQPSAYRSKITPKKLFTPPSQSAAAPTPVPPLNLTTIPQVNQKSTADLPDYHFTSPIAPSEKPMQTLLETHAALMQKILKNEKLEG